MWDDVRFYLALALAVTWPPAVLYWFLVHPFARFWRRLGRSVAFSLLLLIMILIGTAAYHIQKPWLSVHFGTHSFLLILGFGLYVAAVWIRLRIRKELTWRVMVGVPEIDPTGMHQRLLTDGLYARIRHPRYAQIILVILALAFITNYLAVYILFALSVPVLYRLVLLEEKELRDRFGAEYEEYCSRVPRFFPNRKG